MPGFDESRWLPGETPRPFMGRLPIYGELELADDVRLDLNEAPDKPRDSHDEGCPGAWYRSAFVQSLAKYERLMTEHNFASNLLADRCEDRLVLEALQYLESERLRARAHSQSLRSQTK